MSGKFNSEIKIIGANENNLKNVSISIPHYKLVVVTGISGSGKSSLIFDTLAKEGQRRYFETLPTFARQFSGKLNRPNVTSIEGLSPVISIGQHTTGINGKSTVGTVSDLYDLLRLLFARIGTSSRSIQLSRSLFSFNSDHGKCYRCNGIGNEEQIDLSKLIRFPNKSIRDGALAPTLPTGYIMYSQVTIDVLNQVCEAEGFNVDIPWNELTEAQRDVILYGSEKIKVPFGKHSLESRLKWTGIKAKPREEGFYKGMIPIMSDILRRDRNANILKYVHAVECADCNGARLNSDALSVMIHNQRIIDLTSIEINELNAWFKSHQWEEIGAAIVHKIGQQIDLLEDLGLGHLTLNRPANTLSASEIQRIRIANQILVPLSDVLYIFDEPSIGLHPAENTKMINHFKGLVNRGNTVIVVEHDLETILQADHIIDIGPQAGVDGGEVLFNGALDDFKNRTDLKLHSPTYQTLFNIKENRPAQSNQLAQSIILKGCKLNNLKSIDAQFKLGGLNVVSGPSGSGKSSLIKYTLLSAVKQRLGEVYDELPDIQLADNLNAIDKFIYIDHAPIGRTPRSNPATYLGISDAIRDVFSKLDSAKANGITKSMFSFNNKGGRCETCQGAGKTQIGMHFLGNVELVCETCEGKRFNKSVLAIEYKGRSIADVYQMNVDEALAFFSEDKKVITGLSVLKEIGLGYLTLGQSSTTVSGGEAQRIKIANQLQKKDTGNTLYIIIEPSVGLHHSNITSLLDMFDRIKQKGNTIVCIEQNRTVIDASDWHIEMGPKSGKEGGEIVYQGVPLINSSKVNAFALKPELNSKVQQWIELNGVTTHGLKNIDVSIPKNQLTVVTGVSGSGKSSLVYDTLFAEANTRFIESLSTYNRSFIQQNNEAEIASTKGLGPAIGINRKGGQFSKRSTVATLTGVYASLRLMYSRISQYEGSQFTAQHYSFNHHLGACEACNGMGSLLKCNPNQIIVDEKSSLLDGALSQEKGVKYFSNIDGQFIAVLKAVFQKNQWDIDLPWKSLPIDAKEAVLYGIGEQEWNVEWEFKTKSRKGVQQLKSKWIGFCNLIDEEYQRRIQNKNISELEVLLHEVECYSCHGNRLKPELLETKFKGKHISEFTALTVGQALSLIDESCEKSEGVIKSISNHILPSIKSILQSLVDLGLSYLSLNRPVKTLSGGEQQRISLSGQLSNHLFGVTYVLDEPTIGLDQAQIMVLVSMLRTLISNGNTVVVVEHDDTFIREADYVIEMGPKSGKDGGEVVYQGTFEEIKNATKTVTYQLLTRTKERIKIRESIEFIPFGIKQANANNLKNIDVDFKSNSITAITGVSGSGKSSLVRDALFASWKAKRSVGCSKVFGLDQFDDVILIGQEQISSNRLTTPASYTGILENLKSIFAKSKEAKDLGFKRADFSYQSKMGKCPACNGYGKIKTSMDFMSDVWLTCYACKGDRYNENILNVRCNDLTIGQVLKLTINEASVQFDDPKLKIQLDVLMKLGLGHLQLGQAGHTLSGGEAQRLKLSKEILLELKGQCLFIFDEPSTGLHFLDIKKLVNVFNELITLGHTILFIEHNQDLIRVANEVITLGPGSGDLGGALV